MAFFLRFCRFPSLTQGCENQLASNCVTLLARFSLLSNLASITTLSPTFLGVTYQCPSTTNQMWTFIWVQLHAYLFRRDIPYACSSESVSWHLAEISQNVSAMLGRGREQVELSINLTQGLLKASGSLLWTCCIWAVIVTWCCSDLFLKYNFLLRLHHLIFFSLCSHANTCTLVQTRLLEFNRTLTSV